MAKIIAIGECEIRVPAGLVLVGEIGQDRRVATAQRRARGNGCPRPGQFRRKGCSGPYGRRAGDTEAHQNRRDYKRKNGVASASNPLGTYFLRRRGDERRDPARRCYDYSSSHDPRVRELDRRGISGRCMKAAAERVEITILERGIADGLLYGARAK